MGRLASYQASSGTAFADAHLFCNKFGGFIQFQILQAPFERLHGNVMSVRRNKTIGYFQYSISQEAQRSRSKLISTSPSIPVAHHRRNTL